VAAANVPDEGVAKLEPLLRAALVSKPVVDRHKAVGARTVPTSSAELRQFLQSETKRWGEVVRSRGIKLQ
jgi:tripartite-type tricarboxylate transporter receptor subunit TctC